MSVTLLPRSTAARLAAFIVYTAVVIFASSTTAQKRPWKGPYDQGKAHYAAEDPSGYADGEPAEPRPYEEQHDTYSNTEYGEDAYGGAVKGVCLQGFEAKMDGTDLELKLRCCEPKELPDVCLHNDTYVDAPSKKDWKRDNFGFFQDTALNPDYVARCTLKPATTPVCPNFARCRPFDLSCALNQHAAKCGCPFEDGVSLKAKVFQNGVAGKTCFNTPPNKKQGQVIKAFSAMLPASEGQPALEAGAKDTPISMNGGLVYDALVDQYQGAISFVETKYGAIERKGTVQLVSNILVPENPPTVVGYTQDVPDLVNAPQMWIRFASEEPQY